MAGPEDNAEDDMFAIAPPIDKARFLTVSREVLDSSLLIFAAMGLPRHFRRVWSEHQFLHRYSFIFRGIVEDVSVWVYRERHVSESEMAVTMHRLVEEEKDTDAIATVQALGDALKNIFTPPRVLELPVVADLAQLASMATQLLQSGALYRCPEMKEYPRRGPAAGDGNEAPGGEVHQEGQGASAALSTCSTHALRDTMYPEVFVSLGIRGMRGYKPSVESHLGQQGSAHQALDRDSEGRGLSGGDADDGSRDAAPHRTASAWERSEAHKEAIGCCLRGLEGVRKENRQAWEGLAQPHLQALVEAYSAGPGGGLLPQSCQGGGGDTDGEAHGHTHNQAPALGGNVLEAVDAAACWPFAGDSLLAMVGVLDGAVGATADRPEEPMPETDGMTHSSVPGVAKGPDGKPLPATEARAWLSAVQVALLYLAEAEEAADRRDMGGSITCYSCAIEAGFGYLPDRTLASCLGGRAVCHIEVEDYPASRADATAALALDAACSSAYLARGQCHHMLGEHKEALKDLVTAFLLGGDVSDTSAGSQQARIEQVSRDACRERAGTMYTEREVSDTLPGDWLIRSYLGSFRGEQLDGDGDPVDALRPSKDVVLPDGERLFWEGLAHQRAQRYKDALETFTAAVEDPNTFHDHRVHSAAWDRAACFSYLKGDMEGALEAFRRAQELDPLNTRCVVRRASVLCDLDRREEAEDCFETVSSISPGNSDVFLHRGQFHLLGNDYAAAVRDLRKSTAMSPDMPVSWASLGVALFKQAQADAGQPSPQALSACLSVLEEALDKFPTSSETLLFFAEVLTQFGDFSRALDLLGKAAEVEPESPLPFVNGSRVYLALNDLVSARRHLEQALRVDSGCSGAFLDMGQLYMQEGRPQDAMAMYMKGVHASRFPSEMLEALAAHDIAAHHLHAQGLLPLLHAP